MANGRHIANTSTKIHHILMKFGTQFGTHFKLDDSQMTKYEFFLKLKMADGRHFKNHFWP